MQDKFTITNYLKVSEEVLDFQLKSLYPMAIKEDFTRMNLLFLNHDRNFSTFLTIKYLVEHKRVADIYVLSRSMFESIVSMGLLAMNLVADDLERYQEFQYIEISKTYAHLKRLGLQRLSGVHSSDERFIFEKRANYLERWGGNSNSWTGNSLENNVKTIDNAYPSTCNESHYYEYLYCQVYRKGSQSSHSSFAGLSKGVAITQIEIPGKVTALRFIENEEHLIFSCFHSLLVFLSSVRFMGYVTKEKDNCENYFQKIASYIISEP